MRSDLRQRESLPDTLPRSPSPKASLFFTTGLLDVFRTSRAGKTWPQALILLARLPRGIDVMRRVIQHYIERADRE